MPQVNMPRKKKNDLLDIAKAGLNIGSSVEGLSDNKKPKKDDQSKAMDRRLKANQKTEGMTWRR